MMNSSSQGSGSGARGTKQKRIEKELLQLRNLPREYKQGKRETNLGTLLFVRLRPNIFRSRSSAVPSRARAAWTRR